MLTRIMVTLMVCMGVALAGCGRGSTSPGEVTQNYVNAIAEGDYASACAALDDGARATLRRSMHSSAGCRVLLARCLPSNTAQLAKDQAQLFYSNVVVSVSGNQATVKTSGTAVANRIREVTLTNDKGHWLLTSYGKQRCSSRRGRARP
jgi:hypothetical protein